MNPRPLVVLASALLSVGCGNRLASVGPADPEPPAGEVWLTAAQVADAKIQVATVAEQSVDDTILTAGTVTLDDERTGRVFSPVTGRVVQILAPLGSPVK